MTNAAPAHLAFETGTAPACPGPDPQPRGATRFIVPKGAVDCHAHVVGLPPETILAPNRSYTAPVATEAQYLHMLEATGMTRGVLVQISIHGTDNSLMLKALRAHPQRLKGVAVVERDITGRECEELAKDSIVGLRINVMTPGGRTLADIERYGAICRAMGWHLQLFIDATVLAEYGTALSGLGVPLIFDHMGHRPAKNGVQDPGFQNLLGLVQDGAWVKLSGAYRVTSGGFPYTDTIPMARALVAAAPDRCVWGSDWPNVSTWAHMPNVGDLLDLLADWVPDEATRNRILVENPASFYGFDK
ncbi:MAG TPA: amidohydrolase family protein [Acidocella sp.]|jgi:predicted TIM-barrel fold metal-dependent hydrolase|nr:amidohydrolase family protein [Acidocella sp.]